MSIDGLHLNSNHCPSYRGPFCLRATISTRLLSIYSTRTVNQYGTMRYGQACGTVPWVPTEKKEGGDVDRYCPKLDPSTRFGNGQLDLLLYCTTRSCMRLHVQRSAGPQKFPISFLHAICATLALFGSSVSA